MINIFLINIYQNMKMFSKNNNFHKIMNKIKKIILIIIGYHKLFKKKIHLMKI